MKKFLFVFSFAIAITVSVFSAIPAEAGSNESEHGVSHSDHAGYTDWVTSNDNTCGITVTETRICTKNGQKPKDDGSNILPNSACIQKGFGLPTRQITNPPCPPPPVHTYSYTPWSPENNSCGETVAQTRSCIEDGDITKIVDASKCSDISGGTSQTVINPPCSTPTTNLYATKIVCDDEKDLPNWGDGNNNDNVRMSISSSTALDFLANHPNCREVPTWKFEWGFDLANPGDNVTLGGSGWNSFMGSALAMITGTNLWVREQADSSYIPFTGANSTQDVSAEMYCNNDTYNYDNYDYIANPVANQTYYCVGFNVEKTKVCDDDAAINYDSDVSGNEVVDSSACKYPDKVCRDEDATNFDETLGEDEVADNTVCTYQEDEDTKICNIPTATNYDATVGEDEVVDNSICTYTETPKASCTDGKDNDGDGKIDYPNDPGCSNLEDNDESNSTGGRRGVIGGYARPSGEVLGEETSCGIYVNKYLRRGNKNNDIESVKKIQKFLNNYMGSKIVEDGIFGADTESELKKFQMKHADKILFPWKLTIPTGILYLTTQTEINNIMCPDLKLPIPALLPIGSGGFGV